MQKDNSKILTNGTHNVLLDNDISCSFSESQYSSKSSRSFANSRLKDSQMYHNFNSRKTIYKLSSFPSEISINEIDDASTMSAHYNLEMSHRSDGSPVNSYICDNLNGDDDTFKISDNEMGSGSDTLEDDVSILSDDLLPFEKFIDIGDF